MVSLCLFLILSLSIANAQTPQSSNQNPLSVTLEEDVLDDSITEIFNTCKCVIFYQCDEDNFIIPEDKLHSMNITSNTTLRSVWRIRCSNEFYYCCKNRNERRPVQFPTRPSRRPSRPPSTPALPPRMPPTPFSNSNCGQTDFAETTKIIQEFPWVVAIYQKRNTGIYRFVCGGSLIHPRVVMTEQKCAHSYPFDDFKVVARRETVGENVTLLEVEDVIKASSTYGIDLIVLQTPLTSTRTVCLPNFGQNFSERRCTAVAWSGATPSGRRKLRKVNLSITDNERCHNLSDFSISDIHQPYICAVGEDEEETCKNEGGSALMCEENGRYVQIGILPWGLRCGQKDVPSLYTNVANLVTWIQEKLRNF